MDKTLDAYFSLCTEVEDLSKPNSLEDAYAFDQAVFLFEGETLQAVRQQGLSRGSIWPKPTRTLKDFDQFSSPSEQDESIIYECKK